MSRPTQDPTWADASPAASRLEPSSSLRETGWLAGVPLPSRVANYLWGALGDWVEWFRQPRDVTIDMGARYLAPWDLLNTEQATIEASSIIVRRGLKPTSGVTTGSAQRGLPVDRIASAGEVRLKEVRLNYKWDGAGSSIVVGLTRANPDHTVSISQTVIASDTLATESAALAAFVWAADAVLDPAFQYGITITMARNNAAHTVEVYDVRAVLTRPVGEG